MKTSSCLPAERDQPYRRPRILFISEDISLAQVVRLRQLAHGLPEQQYDVHFAAARFDPRIFDGTRFQRHRLTSLSPTEMQVRQRLGLRLHGTRWLSRYVREELDLLDRLRPDVIVGDLRLSLCVSADVSRIPYAPLINAYWSPYAQDPSFPIPEHPAVSLLGLRRVARHYAEGLPVMLAYHAKPINELRTSYGLPSIGTLPDVLTHGDRTLYPDIPELVPMQAGLPASHCFLGPVLWSPAGDLPPALAHKGKPLVYVTLGSSGALRTLRPVLRALARLPVQVLLATAGRFEPRGLPDNVLASDFVPGHRAARLADLVICNGGSSTGYQALYEGTPVLGLPANLDQYLAMTSISRAGAGRLLRSGTVSQAGVYDAAQALLNDASYREAAGALARAFRGYDSGKRFQAQLDSLTGQRAFQPATVPPRPLPADTTTY